MFEAKALLKAQQTLLTFPEKTYNLFSIRIRLVLQPLQLLLPVPKRSTPNFPAFFQEAKLQD
jgi:hypothetical protein